MSAHIRLATPDDGAAIAAIYAPSVTEQPASFELEPPTAAEMASRIARITACTPWLCCEREGLVLGYAYASPHRDRAAYQWSVEVSAYVAPQAQRRGIGRALYRSLFAVLALQEFRNAYAGIVLPNPASVGLHEAIGFALVGVYHGVGYKLGRWQDVAWFERRLLERTGDPPPPRALPDVVSEPGFPAALAAGRVSLAPGGTGAEVR